MTEERKDDGTRSVLEAVNLKKIYGNRTVVKDVSISVKSGEVVGLLGPNGAGKTTTFYMIVGLVSTNGGSILLNGKSIQHLPIYKRSRLGVTYLPQENSVFRSLTAAPPQRIQAQRDPRQPCWRRPPGLPWPEAANGRPYSSGRQP